MPKILFIDSCFGISTGCITESIGVLATKEGNLTYILRLSSETMGLVLVQTDKELSERLFEFSKFGD